MFHLALAVTYLCLTSISYIECQTWGTWTPFSECDASCRRVQVRTRVCQPQPGDCPGSSFEERPCPCDFVFNAQVDCGRCREVVNGIGYFPDPCSCSNFYQCQLLEGGVWIGQLQRCPRCLFWDDPIQTCNRLNDQQCIYDRDTVTRGSVIVEGVTCTDGDQVRRSIPGQPTRYFDVTAGIARDCAPGTAFVVRTCRCDTFVQPTFPSVTLRPPRPFREVACLSFDQGWDGLTTSTQVYVSSTGVTFAPGLSGSAGVFDGASWLEIPYYQNRPLGDFSVSFFYMNTGANSPVEGLLSNGDCSKDGTIEISLLAGTTVQVRVENSAGATTTVQAQAAAAGWHHVALTYDGRVLTLYVDGTAQSSTSSANGNIRYTKCTFTVGRRNVGDYFTGLIDELCFYDSVLSAATVTSIFNDLLG